METIRLHKKFLEEKIGKMLEQEAKELTEQYAGRQIVFWEMDHHGDQHKKIGCIKEVKIDIDVYENYFVSICFELTGGTFVLLEEVEKFV